MLPRLDAHEIMRVGALVEHYQHHVTDHADRHLSFFEFLIDHYASGADEDPEHETLPLHDHGTCVGMAACEVHSANSVVEVQVTRQRATEPPTMISYCDSSAVFQPPRV